MFLYIRWVCSVWQTVWSTINNAKHISLICKPGIYNEIMFSPLHTNIRCRHSMKLIRLKSLFYRNTKSVVSIQTCLRAYTQHTHTHVCMQNSALFGNYPLYKVTFVERSVGCILVAFPFEKRIIFNDYHLLPISFRSITFPNH